MSQAHLGEKIKEMKYIENLSNDYKTQKEIANLTKKEKTY